MGDRRPASKKWATEGRPLKIGRPKVGPEKWSSRPMGQYIRTKLTRRVIKSGLNWSGAPPRASTPGPSYRKGQYNRTKMARTASKLILNWPKQVQTGPKAQWVTYQTGLTVPNWPQNRNSKLKPEIETQFLGVDLRSPIF